MNPEKRAQILDVAKKRFERFGFSKTTVDEIASDAGISKRTLYQGFGNKEKILEELFMFEAISVRKAITNHIKKIDGPLNKVQTYLRLVERYFDQNPFICNVLHDESGLFAPFLKDKPQLVEEGIEEIIVSILREGVREGVFRKMEEKDVGHFIFLLFKGVTYGQSCSNRPIKVNKTNELIKFIRSGILADQQKLKT